MRSAAASGDFEVLPLQAANPCKPRINCGILLQCGNMLKRVNETGDRTTATWPSQHMCQSAVNSHINLLFQANQKQNVEEPSWRFLASGEVMSCVPAHHCPVEVGEEADEIFQRAVVRVKTSSPCGKCLFWVLVSPQCAVSISHRHPQSGRDSELSRTAVLCQFVPGAVDAAAGRQA